MKNIKSLSFLLTSIIILLSFNVSSLAETKNDCSQYTNKTFMGMLDKKRCEKGKPPREKFSLSNKLKKLNPLNKN